MMTEKDKHLNYLKIEFDCSVMNPVLSEKELNILKKYGTWMEALFLKKINPLTEKQIAFCRQLELDKPPKEKYANVFWKYLKRKDLAKKNVLNNVRKKIKDDRDDWKKIRKMRF